MEKARKLSLTNLSKTQLESVKGGAQGCSWGCGCACAYTDNGGSSTGDNAVANTNGGLRSPNNALGMA